MWKTELDICSGRVAFNQDSGFLKTGIRAADGPRGFPGLLSVCLSALLPAIPST